MIQLRLKFSNEGKDVQEIAIVDGELLSKAVERAFEGVPLSHKPEQIFNVILNGREIEHGFWTYTMLVPDDIVIISPKIKDGDSGQIFKSVAIIAITIAATYFLGPAGANLGPAALAGASAAVTIGASLLFNALIPPPMPRLDDISGIGSIDSSQMYSIASQSNQMRRLDTVPKVYGTHRVFPTVAALPYTELGVAPAEAAHEQIQDIIYTAQTGGSLGNSITIEYSNTGTAGAETVTVSTKAIKVAIQSGVSTANQIRAAVASNAAAAALVRAVVNGVGAAAQITTIATNLHNGSDSGTVQYLYGIYDFGLGTVQIADLKIGDTPLSTDGFEDFDMNFVDPNRPDIPQDDYDKFFSKEFKYYRGHREITPLSIDIPDGLSTIQDSDANAALQPEEIILDFVAQRGLYGLSSNGAIGERSINLQIYFALVGTSTFYAYNDLAQVDYFKAVGGDDVLEYDQPLIPSIVPVNGPLVTTFDSYYEGYQGIFNGYYFENNSGVNGSRVTMTFTITPGTNKLLVATGPDYGVGSKVFMTSAYVHGGQVYLGNVQSTALYSNPLYTEITLDRIVSGTDAEFLVAYTVQGTVSYSLGHRIYTWGTPKNVSSIRIGKHQSGNAVITGSSTNPVYANFRFRPKVPGQYQIRVVRVNSFGPYATQVADQLTWVGLTTAYLNSPVVTDKRHSFMEIRIKATDQLNGNIQTLSAVCASILLYYDVGSSSWLRKPTSNPAWVFADLLTGEVNRKAISRDKLDLDSIIEWADYCDASPDNPDSGTFNNPRLTCNFILDYGTTLQGVLGQVGGMANASLNIINGKYGVLIDKFKSVPVQIFTPRNSRDFSSTRNYGQRPDGLNIKFIDPNLNWAVSEVIAYDNGFNKITAAVFEDLTAFACTSQEQAWRFGRYMIAQNRLRQEQISILVDFEHLICTRGDYVQLTQDVMEVGGTPCRVLTSVGGHISTDDDIEVLGGYQYGYTYRAVDGTFHTDTLTQTASNEFNLDGDLPAVGDLIVIGIVDQIVFDCIVKTISPNDDMSALLTLVEKADGIFDYESTGALPDYSPQISQSSLVGFKPPNAVENLTVADVLYECAPTRSGYAFYIDLTWDPPIGSVFENYEIYVNDGTGFRLFDSTRKKLFRYTVDQSRLDIQHGFKVAAVSATGLKLELVEMPEVDATPASKTTPPSNVDNFSMSITNQTAQLAWNAIDDCDAYQYLLRYSPDTNDVWEASIPLATLSKNVTTMTVQARVGVYFIKALDYAGNESTTATAIITSIPELFDLNIVEKINEAPSFPGVMEQIELLGEAVIIQERVPGDIHSVVYYDTGYYDYADLLDLGDIFSVRLQSLIRADGLKKGELMSDWTELDLIDHLNTAIQSDWDVSLQYRATETFASMADWDELLHIDHLNFGAGVGFTDWRDIPTTGDATGRLFQFRIKMDSLTPNVTPRVFDASISADMPDRQDSFENLVSSASLATTVSYDPIFNGPAPSPNVQITIDNGGPGDYWLFANKTLEGFDIRFYDKNNAQVSRQFDVVAKGYGRRHTVAI